MVKYFNPYEEANKDKKYYLAITRDNGKIGYDIYFVNRSNDIIMFKNSGSASMMTIDDDVLSSVSIRQDEFIELRPKEYVLVDNLDDCDLDWITQYDFIVIIDNLEKDVRYTIGKSIGFLGNYIEELDKYGRKIYDCYEN